MGEGSVCVWCGAPFAVGQLSYEPISRLCSVQFCLCCKSVSPPCYLSVSLTQYILGFWWGLASENCFNSTWILCSRHFAIFPQPQNFHSLLSPGHPRMQRFGYFRALVGHWYIVRNRSALGHPLSQSILLIQRTAIFFHHEKSSVLKQRSDFYHINSNFWGFTVSYAELRSTRTNLVISLFSKSSSICSVSAKMWLMRDFPGAKTA